MAPYYILLVLAALSGRTKSMSYDYKVHVFTANKHFAGTNARIFVIFLDKKGVQLLGRTEIDSRGDSFEKGSHDVAHIRASNYLGEIASIKIQRGRTDSFGPNWHLDRVEVEDPSNGFLYVFKCDCTLDKADRWKFIRGTNKCKSGYTMSSLKRCEDVNECIKGTSRCPSGSSDCVNTKGSYLCRCKPGFKLSDGICKDVDECAAPINACQKAHGCKNIIGSFKCECAKGYKLENDACEDIDECSADIQVCDSRATCRNNVGSYECICPNGYTLDANNKCTNVDECKTNPCDWKTSVSCTDYDGGYKCHCKPGFYNEKDNVCADINECQTQNACNPRTSSCVNTIGTYQCDCFKGYKPSHDLKSCTALTCNPLVIPTGAVVSPSRCSQQDANSYNDVCTFSCKTGYQMSDPTHSKLKCGLHSSWIGTLPTCSPVKCKPLPVPVNARVIPSQCSSGGNYKDKCTFVCKDGYKLEGSDKISCQPDGRWSDKTPTCTKVQNDLWIRCPPGISVDLQQGESTADVSSKWKRPQTSANVKYVSCSRDKNLRFPAGMNAVTCTASENNVNNKSCTFIVSVYDKEKPVAVDCPTHPMAILTTKGKELVHLRKVKFTDNVAIKSVEYSYKNPAEFNIGRHPVTVTAKDTSGNIAHCTYYVLIKAKDCGSLAAPLDGNVVCNPPFAGTTYCSVSCHDNKVIFNATGNWFSRTWYCMDQKPVWEPTPSVPDCVEYSTYDGSSCPSGKVLITTTQPASPAAIFKACGVCPSGTYYENSKCLKCPAGTYQDTTGNSGKQSCKTCDPNTSSKPGSTTKSDCKAVCSPGFYSADGFHPCYLCNPGEYQSNAGSKSCDKCPGNRPCTRHSGTTSVQYCGPCPAITGLVPSGKVQRLLGSTVQLSCYFNSTTLGSEMIRWKLPFNGSVQRSSRLYVKRLYNDSKKQIGLQLTVRNLQSYHTGNYECIVENQFGEASRVVHVTVLTGQTGGSGAGPLSDEE